MLQDFSLLRFLFILFWGLSLHTVRWADCVFNISRNDLERSDAEERWETMQRCQGLSPGE